MSQSQNAMTPAESLRRIAEMLQAHEVLDFSIRRELGEPLSVGLDGRPDFSSVMTIKIEFGALRQPAPVQEPVAEPDFWTACGWHEGQLVALHSYSSETKCGVEVLVLAAARKEGFKGAIKERLEELGWEIRPAYLAAQSAPQAQQPAPVQEQFPRPGPDGKWALGDVVAWELKNGGGA